MDCGQHFLAGFDNIPSKISFVPLFLKDFIMDRIITTAVIVVNIHKERPAILNFNFYLSPH